MANLWTVGNEREGTSDEPDGVESQIHLLRSGETCTTAVFRMIVPTREENEPLTLRDRTTEFFIPNFLRDTTCRSFRIPLVAFSLGDQMFTKWGK